MSLPATCRRKSRVGRKFDVFRASVITDREIIDLNDGQTSGRVFRA